MADLKDTHLNKSKILDNLLADFGMMPVPHQRLAKLAAQDNHVLVIEASYADFLNPKKVHHHTPRFCAKAIVELYALHPALRIVSCGNRKVANEWTRHFFTMIWGLKERASDSTVTFHLEVTLSLLLICFAPATHICIIVADVGLASEVVWRGG